MNATEPSLSRHSQNQVIARTVVATAVTILVLVALFLWLSYRFYKARQRWKNRFISSFRREEIHIRPAQELKQENGMLKGLVVDGIGLDFLYLKKATHNPNFSKIWDNPMVVEEQNLDKTLTSNINQEIPSKNAEHLETIPEGVALVDNPMNHSPKISMSLQSSTPPPLPPPPPPPLPSAPKMIPKPPTLPIHARVKPSAPVHPPKAGFSVPKPPMMLKVKDIRSGKNESPSEESEKGHGLRPIKLKPLHWDKVSVDVDHSVVWQEINDGFFRFDNNLMENLFGNQGPANGKQKSLASVSSNSTSDAPIFILDQRKSQNTAIVLKSLVISRKEILAAITEGRELDFDTLEKLAKIAPTAEESSSILQFKGNQTKLADAEVFLYYILKSVPSAFTRIKAMLFKSNYDPEIFHLKDSLQALELACKELRRGGILFKLLEAVLKAGNMMNEGTPRGNAQGFNLTALLKLSSVKSTDGKISLLHFVVEQVVQFEGKSIADSGQDLTIKSTDYADNKEDCQDIANTNKQEMEKQYLAIGLPIVRSISTELSNCKKSATIDYDSFTSTCSSLSACSNEIERVLLQCGNTGKDGFFRVMKEFLEECTEELKVVREEQIRVMELVKRTTQYYQAGSSKEKSANPLQLFVIVKNFLDMVDQVCIDITRKMQRDIVRNGSSPPMSPTPRTPLRFQNLKTYFSLEKEGRLSSDSQDDF
ncbi:hypothetical protein Leryth_013053 [Lithospermum erythrorhizon]|nr:hypothetical protein Leryth_013053 [Lithospermum erythrorhizon]